jgi:hypothetical protein
MTEDEMKLDMLVAELDRENRLLRARNERLEKEAEQRKPWVGLTDEEFEQMLVDAHLTRTDLMMIGACVYDIRQMIEAKLREKNT